MTNDPIYLLQPVFNYLDELIRDQGDQLFLVFAYGCFVVTGWILSGGLRRRRRQQPHGPYAAIILVKPSSPETPPLPSVISEVSKHNDWPCRNGDDENSFAA